LVFTQQSLSNSFSAPNGGTRKFKTPPAPANKQEENMALKATVGQKQKGTNGTDLVQNGETMFGALSERLT
jgi:hypothetical protein